MTLIEKAANATKKMKNNPPDASGLEKEFFEIMVLDFLSDHDEYDLILCDEPELDEDGNWMQCVKGVDDNRIYTLHYTNDMDIYIVV